jgi:hypothetical protein
MKGAARTASSGRPLASPPTAVERIPRQQVLDVDGDGIVKHSAEVWLLDARGRE